ncbi:uncharacterized protein LOC127745788 isoform X2 [Arachis duranensis]|uniref:phosphopyruvate hydratase n=1 Tax=Arachis duranensis TaxID=130453 RepID=A0A9C6TJZ3_ARADU|nr:uncharacterized protein LOC127745788 isoform X2 [Arachis duranensis]XP_052115582.1 uncharacterized protein LOC127745788 isoform X2 [Arachis duranensis]
MKIVNCKFWRKLMLINQVGTVKEVNEVVKHAKETYNKVVTSRRCGKTIHAFIAAIGIEKIRQKSSDNLNSVLMPIAMIDQDSDSEVTIVQLSFGDGLGARIDMVTWLFEIYLCSNSKTLQSI